MTRAFPHVLLIAGLALLPGCQGFHPRPLSPDRTAAAFDARSLDDPALGEFVRQHLTQPPATWPPAAWDLDALTLATIYFQPDLAVTRASWREAKAGVKTAGQRPNPTVGPAAGYDFDSPAGVNPWLPGISLDVPIETAGKRAKRIAQAKHLTEAARWNFAAAVWHARATLRQALIDLTAATQREVLLGKQVGVQEEALRLLENRRQVGDVSRAEVSPAGVALAKARMDLNDARQQTIDARARLADAIGLPVKSVSLIQLTFDLSRVPGDAADQISAEARRAALRSRADIRAALADYAASEDALRLEVAKQYPDIHLTQGYQWDQAESKWTPGFTVELPVLNHNQGPIAEARARRQGAAARFSALQAHVINEIDRAVAAFQVARQNLTSLESLTAAQRQQATAAEAQFKAGAIERADYLNSQNEAAAGELTRLDAQVKLQQAVAALEDAVQRPTAWSEALQNVAPKKAMKKERKHE